jgi:hypothetical protein
MVELLHLVGLLELQQGRKGQYLGLQGSSEAVTRIERERKRT